MTVTATATAGGIANANTIPAPVLSLGFLGRSLVIDL
jgi:hypothetical protein